MIFKECFHWLYNINYNNWDSTTSLLRYSRTYIWWIISRHCTWVWIQAYIEGGLAKIYRQRYEFEITWLKLTDKQLDSRKFITSRWWFLAFNRATTRLSWPIRPFANFNFLTICWSRRTSAAYTFLSTSISYTSPKWFSSLLCDFKISTFHSIIPTLTRGIIV